jgi:hypothetical protein
MSKNSKLIKNYIKKQINIFKDPITFKLNKNHISDIAENTSDFLLSNPRSKIINILKDPIWKRIGLSYYCGDAFSDFKEDYYNSIYGSVAYNVAARAFMGEKKLEDIILKHADGAVCMQLLNFKFSAGEPIQWKYMVMKQDHRIISKCNSHAPYNILKWGYDNNIKNMTADTKRKAFDSLYKKAYTYPHKKETVIEVINGIKNKELPCTPSQIIHSIKKSQVEEYLNIIMHNIAGLNKDEVFCLYPTRDYSSLICYLIKSVNKSKLPFYITLGNHFPNAKSIIKNIMNGQWA